MSIFANMKTRLYILSLTIILVLSSCIGIKKKCPEFDDEIMAWIPYEQGDIIKLSNSDLDSTITILIQSQYIDHMESYKTNEKCGQCDDYITINNSQNSQFNYSASTHYQELGVETFYFSINDTLVRFETNVSQIIPHYNYNVEGIDYQNVKIYTNQKTSDKNFYCLIIAKNIGIVALIDNYERYWAIDNNEIRNVNLNIKSGPC